MCSKNTTYCQIIKHGDNMKPSTILFGALASLLIIGGIYAYNTDTTVNGTISNVVDCCYGFACHVNEGQAWCGCGCCGMANKYCHGYGYEYGAHHQSQYIAHHENNTVYNNSAIQYRIEIMENNINTLKEQGVDTSFMEERLNEIKEYYGLN